ncbi:ATP-binding cassette domain-containing protein [Nakamurella sp. A5-74]|uniref:ATP-binding cassette domain-containing protein n=1 Tax=Nakamurella sp. A5-74 TaxID=3158264 RepID=A0AAU8DKG5_9ACTN
MTQAVEHSDRSGISVTDLSHVYRAGGQSVEALSRADLAVSAGEFLAVMGISGSGKSTLVSILGGLLVPSGGEVNSFGFDLVHCSSDERARYRAEVATVVFQEFNLFSMLTAQENVATALELWGHERAEATTEATTALEKVGLADLGDRFPGQLSGGQRQRVAIARALAARRPLVLADEPTAAIDRHTGATVRALFRTLADQGSTVIVATHDPQFAQAADRVLDIVDGHMVAASAL